MYISTHTHTYTHTYTHTHTHTHTRPQATTHLIDGHGKRIAEVKPRRESIRQDDALPFQIHIIQHICAVFARRDIQHRLSRAALPLPPPAAPAPLQEMESPGFEEEAGAEGSGDEDGEGCK